MAVGTCQGHLVGKACRLAPGRIRQEMLERCLADFRGQVLVLVCRALQSGYKSNNKN